MPEIVDAIVVSATHHHADAADLHVIVRGSSLVTGSAALKKAAEARRLVEDLAAAGLADEDVALQGVSAEVSSGLLGRSSTAQYRLRVRVRDLDRLPDVL